MAKLRELVEVLKLVNDQLSDEITRKLSNQACFAGCAESDVWFALRTLKQNGGYVEYSRCSDIILHQPRMVPTNQSINHFI